MENQEELAGLTSGYSETQELLRRSLRDLLREHSPPALSRRSLTDPGFFHAELWQAMLSAGWVGALYEERAGGQELGFENFAPAIAECGRFLMPGPFFSSAVASPLVLSVCDPERELDPVIRAAVAESQIASVALWERPLRGLQPEVATVVTRAGTITGTKHFVPDAGYADVLFILARGEDGRTGLAAVSARSKGVSIASHNSLAGRNICTVELDGAPVLGWTTLKDETLLPRAIAACAVATAGLQVGGAHATVVGAADYARSRVQFGRPIGSFQAVSHRLSDMYCSLAVGRALWLEGTRSACADVGDTLVDASMAKAWNNRMYERVTASALQVFAGIGYTFEHDIHLFLRMARVLSADYGTTADHTARLRSGWFASRPLVRTR